MPKKFIRCVKKVSQKIKLSGYKGNPYAICRKSTGGKTKHGLIQLKNILYNIQGSFHFS